MRRPPSGGLVRVVSPGAAPDIATYLNLLPLTEAVVVYKAGTRR